MRETCQGNSSGGHDEPGADVPLAELLLVHRAGAASPVTGGTESILLPRVRSAAHMRSRVASSAIGFAVVGMTAVTLMSSTPSAQSGRSAPLDSLQTRAERTSFTETSRYDDVKAFLDTVDAASRPRPRDDLRLHLRGPAAAAGRGRPRRRRHVRPRCWPRTGCASTCRPTSTPARSRARRRCWRWSATSPGASTPTGCRRWCCSSIPTTTPTATRRSR